ncbi:MAG: TetR/AcrR family transcriptional regulator [Actinomycetota bacterium]
MGRDINKRRIASAEADPIREAILAAALESFGRHGPRATSLSQIATAAGVSRPTLYSRYADKDQLFRAVLERECDVALDRAHLAAKTGAPFAEVLRDVLIAYYGTLYDTFHPLPGIDDLFYTDNTADVIARTRKAFSKELRTLVSERVEQGEISLESSSVKLNRVVDLLRVTPHALKDNATSRSRFLADLADFAHLMARALAPTPEDGE